uniref:DDE_Tnp_1_7 domain-containing protein n=1 Tax=Glossina pallidipes TaxID=7398 RepID=A0A1A9ZC51_GLOPL
MMMRRPTPIKAECSCSAAVKPTEYFNKSLWWNVIVFRSWKFIAPLLAEYILAIKSVPVLTETAEQPRLQRLTYTLHCNTLSGDNADNIELSHESDSNDNNTFPESDAGENVEDTTGSRGNGEWIDVSEVDKIPSTMDFDISPRIAGPQISNDIRELLDFFRLYFTDALIGSIVKETNDYANSKLRRMQFLKRSIWNTWSDVNRKEFLAFIGVILNMGTMPLANLQEYWCTKFTNKIPFFSDVFTRDRFLQIFWRLHLHKNAPED